MRKSSLIVICGAVLLLCQVGVTIANECHRPLPPDSVEVLNTGRELYFDPLDEYQSMILVVTGSWGYSYTKEVGPSEKIVFELGETTYDGCYSWEIRTAPFVSPEIKDLLQRARDTGDMEPIRRLWMQGELPDRARVQSGNFRVINREIVADDRPEDKGKLVGEAGAADGPAKLRAEGSFEPAEADEPQMTTMASLAKDFVINDDLIVDGSACIGFDCFNGWSFSFTTIGMSEHNTRIKFDDTSTAASFPRNDWMLMANDSTNGGVSRFAIMDCGNDSQGNCSGPIPFTIEAGAPANGLYVDDGGRVGFGTSSPSVELHTIDGDTPTLRLAQDGSSGFAPQTWDIAGNETNFFVRDVTNGSTLPFRIAPDQPSSALTIRNDKVGVGTWSPESELHVVGADTEVLKLENNGNVKMVMENTSASGHTWAINNATQLRFAGDGPVTAQMALDLSGNLTIQGTLTQSSNRNAKENIKPVEPRQVLEQLADLEISTWTFKADDPSVTHLGPMAQDFYEIFGLGIDETHIAPVDTSGVALAAIKGLSEMLEQKDEEIASLEQRIEALEGLLVRLVGDQAE